MADEVDQFVALLRETPGIEATADRPADPAGESFIDIAGPGFEMIHVSYRPSAGFGFFTASDGFGQRPDIIIADPVAAAERVLEGILAPAARR